MKGATVENSAIAISTIRTNSVPMSGTSQNFLRSRAKPHRSLSKSSIVRLTPAYDTSRRRFRRPRMGRILTGGDAGSEVSAIELGLSTLPGEHLRQDCIDPAGRLVRRPMSSTGDQAKLEVLT